MIAVKRLQSLFWVLLVAFGALAAYLISLRVATERNELAQVRAQIASTRADIRYLETEFASRANMRQLEKWNAEDFRYSALPASHYLSGERALAHLDGVEPNGPTYVAQPVLVAMVEPGLHEGTQGDSQPSSPAALQIRSDVATIRAVGAEDRRVRSNVAEPAAVNGKAAPAQVRQANAATVTNTGLLARKAERMAMLDARLLDENTMGDIGRRAAIEVRRSVR